MKDWTKIPRILYAVTAKGVYAVTSHDASGLDCIPLFYSHDEAILAAKAIPKSWGEAKIVKVKMEAIK